MAVVVLAPLLLIGQSSGLKPLTMITPSANEWFLLGAIGLLGTVAHLLMTWSLRYAPASTLAPMQYLEIPVATGIGWLIFRDLPNTMATVGILITIAAGPDIVVRERNQSRLQKQPGPGAVTHKPVQWPA